MKKKKKNRSGMNLKKELEDIFSMLSLCSDSHAENIGREKIKSTGKKRGRPPKNPCRALIPLDTAKIRWEYQREYKRRKRVLESLETQLQQYEESDEPEYRKYLARTFGAEQTLLREDIPAAPEEQPDLFADYEALKKKKAAEQAELDKEKRLQQAVLNIKKRMGANAILKGMNLEKGATGKVRNEQIGGHRK